MAMLAAGLMLAGSSISAYGAYQQGKAARAEAEYNAQVSENNAISAQYATQAQKEQHNKQMFKLIGESRAAAAASGVEISGSVLDTIMEAAEEGEYEQRLIEYEGKLEAMGLRNEANLYRYQGKTARQAGASRAWGTLLTGAGQAVYMAGIGRSGGGADGGGSGSSNSGGSNSGGSSSGGSGSGGGGD